MYTTDSWIYRIFLSDQLDGPFFSNNRLPIFSDWIIPDQIHKDGIVCINTVDEILSTDFTQADGILSCISNKIFWVKLADCNGVILLWDLWYAVIHAGWRGLKEGIIEKAIETLTYHGEKVENLSIFCSPSIRVCCYEVGNEFLEYFPAYCFQQENGKYHFDGIWFIRDALISHGVLSEHIQIHPSCTCCEESFYSYRRNHTEDRMVFWVEKIS